MLDQDTLRLNTVFDFTSAVSSSPVSSMAQPVRTASQDASDAIRKRVCKACDRCRLKKSKCDGSHPCSRCRADNAICVFGERKKSHDKVYPKGYVEMLEQQQGQLVSGLTEMYRRLLAADAWDRPALPESNGHPLTHDILAALNLLETKQDGSGDVEMFEEDPQKLQKKLIAEGAGFVPRRGSISSDSDHSQHDHSRSASSNTPLSVKPMFRDVNFNSATSSPVTRSPVQRHRQSFPPAQPSPLQQSSPVTNDPQFYQAEWAVPNMSQPEPLARSRAAMQMSEPQHGLPGLEDAWNGQFDYDMNFGMPMTSYPQQLSNNMGSAMQEFAPPFDPEQEFNKWIQIMT